MDSAILCMIKKKFIEMFNDGDIMQTTGRKIADENEGALNYIAINFIDNSLYEDDIKDDIYEDINYHEEYGTIGEYIRESGYIGNVLEDDYYDFVNYQMKKILKEYKSYNIYYAENSTGIDEVIRTAINFYAIDLESASLYLYNLGILQIF